MDADTLADGKLCIRMGKDSKYTSHLEFLIEKCEKMIHFLRMSNLVECSELKKDLTESLVLYFVSFLDTWVEKKPKKCDCNQQV